MANEGWVKLRRELAEDPIWTDEKPFTRGQALVDLLMQVTYKTHTTGGKRYRAGCVYTTTLILAERWGWTRSKVRWFLKQMEAEKKLKVQMDRLSGCEIFVVGWNPGEPQPRKHTVKSAQTGIQQPTRPTEQPRIPAVESAKSGNQQPTKQPYHNTVGSPQGIPTVEGRDDGVTGGRLGISPEGEPPRPGENEDWLSGALGEVLEAIGCTN